jgi:hypothetical protein
MVEMEAMEVAKTTETLDAAVALPIERADLGTVATLGLARLPVAGTTPALGLPLEGSTARRELVPSLP